MKRASAAVTVVTGAALGLAAAAWSGSQVSGAAPGAGAPPAAAKGEAFDSGDVHMVLPLGLQASSAYVRDDNPMSGAKIDLGRALYFDTRLSADKSVSCATCHDPSKGFSDGRAT